MAKTMPLLLRTAIPRAIHYRLVRSHDRHVAKATFCRFFLQGCLQEKVNCNKPNTPTEAKRQRHRRIKQKPFNLAIC